MNVAYRPEVRKVGLMSGLLMSPSQDALCQQVEPPIGKYVGHVKLER